MRSRNAPVILASAWLVAAEGCTDAPKTTEARFGFSIAAVSSVHVQAIVGQVVTPDLTVRVTDPDGKPVAGANVFFFNSEYQFLAVTGSDGLASGAWRLGQVAGTQTLTARIYNPATMPRPVDVTFSATALPDTVAAIHPFTVDALSGLPSQVVLTSPIVAAVDEYSNAKPGVSVRFETIGGGSVTPEVAVTDADGRAFVGAWTLGSDVGVDTLVARVGALPPVYFTARVSPPFRALAVVTGNESTCAIALGGEVYCWGTNRRGQVNAGDPVGLFILPQRIPLPAKAVNISGGYNHTCAITDEVPSQAYCWGDNSTGQLGAAVTRSGFGGPQKIPVVEGLVSVTAGMDHSCGLNTAGVAYCWGNGIFGQLGTGDITGCFVSDIGMPDGCRGPRPVVGSVRFATLAAGVSHTCGVTLTGQLSCWGLNDGGQLGFATDTPCSQADYYYGGTSPVACALTPQTVLGTPVFSAVGAGDGTCALAVAGTVSCFGPPRVVALIPPVVSFARITPDGECGVGSDDNAYCWTGDFDAQSASFADPRSLGYGLVVTAITSGRSHRCAILKSDASVVCWGSNDSGQLGIGTTLVRDLPAPVLAPPRP